jgi:hypothetical protein
MGGEADVGDHEIIPACQTKIRAVCMEGGRQRLVG